MKLNREKWLTDVRATEESIRALKAQIRTPGHFASYREYADLWNLKNHATCLYMVRVHVKGSGKLHMTKTTEYVHDLTNPGNVIKKTTPFGLKEQEHTFNAFAKDYVTFDSIPDAVVHAAIVA